MPFVYARRGSSVDAIDVSRYGGPPWRQLSPFCQTPAAVPVPGFASYLDFHFGDDWPEFFATSVEGIWQGLKQIEGICQTDAMRKPPRKRRGRPEGHNYGDYRLLGYARAKALVYIPAYLSQLRLQGALIDELRRRAVSQQVTIVDVSYQPEVFGPRPISHAALLVDYLDGKLQPYEDAHDRLQELTTTIDAAYQPNDADLSFFDHIARRVRELTTLTSQTAEPREYASGAQLFERENLMLMSIRCVGSHEEMPAGQRLLEEWISAGLLTLAEARSLSQVAPVCRWNELWLNLP